MSELCSSVARQPYFSLWGKDVVRQIADPDTTVRTWQTYLCTSSKKSGNQNSQEKIGKFQKTHLYAANISMTQISLPKRTDTNNRRIRKKGKSLQKRYLNTKAVPAVFPNCPSYLTVSEVYKRSTTTISSNSSA